MPYVEMSDLQKLLALIFLKAAPQDISYSKSLARQWSILYIIISFIVLQTTINNDVILPGIMLSLLITAGFVYIVLNAMKKVARFVQTFTAMIGVSAILNLVSWPVFMVLSNDAITETTRASMSLLFLIMMGWEIMVKTHIFRHALEVHVFSALALSFALLFISVAMSRLLLPQMGAG